VIWEDRIFLTTALPDGAPSPGTSYNFDVLCLNRKDGKVLWNKTARQAVPHEKHHQDHGYASGSPIVDGDYVFAYFGSRGLHCYDLQGNLKWSREFGKMQTRNSFGEGASPALRGEIVVVNWDDESTNDFIAALDRKTGKELWRTARDESTGWSTPLIVSVGGKQQVVVNASNRVRSYDLDSGKQIWECGGQTANAIPTPVAAGDTVFVTSGFRGSTVTAINLTRTGDLTGTDAIRWSRGKNTPYVPSPLLHEGLLYLVTGNNPVLNCLHADTGTPAFEGQRLEGLNGVYASPIAAGGHIYVMGRNGTAVVLKAGTKLEVVSTNQLSDKIDASPAVAGNELFIRGHEFLYCIAE
jgi:outer membrane protein assembly factor BamB